MSKFDYSRPLDIDKWSDDEQFNHFIDNLFFEIQDMKGIKSGNARILKSQLKVLVLDLWDAWEEKLYVGYQRNKNYYSGTKFKTRRYNLSGISYKIVSLIDALAEKKYIETSIGYYDRDKGRSRISRMKARKKLVNKIERAKLLSHQVIGFSRNRECIILRNSKKENIDYRESKKTRIMRSNLYDYNNLLLRTFIDIPGYPVDGAVVGSKKIKINHRNRFVRRIFNNGSFNDGGRFYGGWWQQIPREWRERIRINNIPTVEIDFSGLHIALLYLKAGIDYFKDIKSDPYQITGYEKSDKMRRFLKEVLLTIINAKENKEAIKSIRQSIGRTNKDEYEWIKDSFGWDKLTDKNIRKLLDDFIAPHQAIKKYFFSGTGVKLQNIDAQIADYVIQEMTRDEIPVLCVHDSFIVSVDDKKELEHWMRSGFQKVMRENRIKPKMKSKGDGINWFKAKASNIQELKENSKKATEQLKIKSSEVENDDGYRMRLKEWKKVKFDGDYYRQEVKKFINNQLINSVTS